ncbi:MAG TPA: ATP-binding protein [Azonexus sp.]|nr:ATP-binding protein [Azonexus sp.]
MLLQKKPIFTKLAIALAMLAIFAIDLKTPLGLAVPFLYLLLALIAIGVEAPTRILLAIAVLGPLLAGLKLLIQPADGVAWLGQANRVLFSVLIWVAVGFEWVRRTLEAGRRENSRELERQVRERTADWQAANRKLESEVAERKAAEATIIDYTQRLQALTQQLVEVRDAERKALATELHDRIGQNLSALNMSLNLNLALLATQLPPAAMDAARARINDTLALVEQTTEAVRGVMEELHPALLEQYGLTTALRWHGEEFSGRTGIAFRCLANESFPRLRGQVETTLFRIAQEALINVAKHADASEFSIGLERTTTGIALTVADDGVGIGEPPAQHAPAGGGWGLAIMAERARSIGAELRIASGEARGTTVVVSLANGLWEAA